MLNVHRVRDVAPYFNYILESGSLFSPVFIINVNMDTDSVNKDKDDFKSGALAIPWVSDL